MPNNSVPSLSRSPEVGWGARCSAVPGIASLAPSHACSGRTGRGTLDQQLQMAQRGCGPKQRQPGAATNPLDPRAEMSCTSRHPASTSPITNAASIICQQAALSAPLRPCGRFSGPCPRRCPSFRCRCPCRSLRRWCPALRQAAGERQIRAAERVSLAGPAVQSTGWQEADESAVIPRGGVRRRCVHSEALPCLGRHPATCWAAQAPPTCPAALLMALLFLPIRALLVAAHGCLAVVEGGLELTGQEGEMDG